jgi:hypothetical protein
MSLGFHTGDNGRAAVEEPLLIHRLGGSKAERAQRVLEALAWVEPVAIDVRRSHDPSLETPTGAGPAHQAACLLLH